MASSNNLCSSVGTETPMQDSAVDSAVDHKGYPAWRSDSGGWRAAAFTIGMLRDGVVTGVGFWDERHGRILRWGLRSCLGHGSGSCFETGVATKGEVVGRASRVRVRFGIGLSSKTGVEDEFQDMARIGFRDRNWGWVSKWELGSGGSCGEVRLLWYRLQPYNLSEWAVGTVHSDSGGKCECLERNGVVAASTRSFRGRLFSWALPHDPWGFPILHFGLSEYHFSNI
ncbi:hypothetical protein TIFTF001_020953 [Ficus carica]|uniref:Uncharacterized protein n=1 Tax=Ficus carica TaxID=3494 RepID=A0AA88AJJ2_FICCA|nr:hypothetical protein TIFTF001_020953 [Ficus carica]